MIHSKMKMTLASTDLKAPMFCEYILITVSVLYGNKLSPSLPPDRKVVIDIRLNEVHLTNVTLLASRYIN